MQEDSTAVSVYLILWKVCFQQEPIFVIN